MLSACAAGAGAQSRSDDPVGALLGRLEDALNKTDRPAIDALFDASVSRALVERFTDQLLVPGAVRSVVRERDRAQLEGAPPGDGHRLVVEMFVETAGRARA